MVLILAAFWLIGISLIVLMLRAVLKGPEYIGGGNFGWGDVGRWVPRRDVKYRLLLLSPISVVVVSGWAGYSIFSDLLSPFGNAGFVHREVGEWRTYQDLVSAMVGAPLGIAFGIWLVRLCEKSWRSRLVTDELTPIDWLQSKVL